MGNLSRAKRRQAAREKTRTSGVESGSGPNRTDLRALGMTGRGRWRKRVTGDWTREERLAPELENE